MTTPYVEQEAWARIVLGITVAAFILGELSRAFNRRPGIPPADTRGEVVFRLVFVAGVSVLPLARTLTPAATWTGGGVFVLGVVIGWFGLALRWWSFATLGSSFTFVVHATADQAVVSRGPYRLLRHPSYTGLLAVLLGLGLMLGNWLGVLLSFPVILIALIYRLLREERVMSDALGAAYLQFAEGRARLLPFVW